MTPTATKSLTKKQQRRIRRQAARARASASAAAARGSASASAVAASAHPTPGATDAEGRLLPDKSTSGVAFGQLVLAFIATVLLALLVVWLGWQIIVALSWRSLRRRLGSGLPHERIVGAWLWVRARRARFDEPLPVHASPDVAVGLAQAAGDVPLEQVATLAAGVAFSEDPQATDDEAAAAWAAAGDAARRPAGAPLRSRLRWALRRPIDPSAR